jgi:phosphatidylglycerophosphate synthase/choline kinase
VWPIGGQTVKVVVWATEGEKALTKLCGVPLVKRLLYTLRAADLRDVIIVTGPGGHTLKEVVGGGQDLGMCITYVEGLPQLGRTLNEAFLVIEGNYVLDERILKKLAEWEGMAIAYDSREEGGIQVAVAGGKVKALSLPRGDGAYVGASRCSPEVLPFLEGHDWAACLAETVHSFDFAALDAAGIEPYVAEIRRELPTSWFRIESQQDVKRCKRMLVEGAQKRTLDVLAWYFHRPIENCITYHIADLPITPNLMSGLTYVVAGLVTFLLLSGRLLPASLLAFVVNIMDGLDGKLARVKGMATKLGQLEHSFDLLYEQSWYIALAWAVHKLRGDALPLAVGFIAVLFDSLARHVSMQFRQVMGVALADYAPFDRLFRRFDGRRNIYTIYILLATILGVPLYALLAIAGHAIVTSMVYACRAARHLRHADLGLTARQR